MRSVELEPPPRPAGASQAAKSVQPDIATPLAINECAPLLLSARLLLIATISYAAWRFGGTDTTALYHVAICLSVVLSLCLVAMVAFHWRPVIPSATVVLLPGLFIAYSLLQIASLPHGVASTVTRAGMIQRDYGNLPAQQVARAAMTLGSEVSTPAATAFSSVIPQHSKAALIPFALAAVVCLLSSLLFNTTPSRKLFLWCILLHTFALAVWGIIQRSNGSLEILPGMAHLSRGLPFSSFIYRNAGAAALLPGIAAAAALISISVSGSNRPANGRFAKSNSSSAPFAYSNRHYGNRENMLSVRELVIISLGCVIVVGVVASLSRGAWIAGGLSLVVAALALRSSFRVGKGAVMFIILAAIIAVATAQMTNQIEARMKRLSLHDVSQDARWEHWKVGWETAVSHFPFGSGLGTYGYATLLHQTEPTRVWFREAHNEYLEMFAETGVLGLVLLLFTIVWFARRNLHLLTTWHPSEHRAVGLFGLMVLVCATVQSATDFVITIPANLLLYASFFGLTGSVTVIAVRQRHRAPSAVDARLAAIGFAGALAALLACMSYSRLERHGDLALAQTSVAELKDPISPEWLAERVAILDAAIESQPDRAALYRHRAMYHFASYRLSLVGAAQRQGETIAWENTQPEAIYSVLTKLSPASRESTLENLVATASMREPLSLALADLANGLYHNPLFCQLHLTAAAISPMGRWEPKAWIERAFNLSHSDPDKLFLCGLLAYFDDDTEAMKVYWRDCMDISRSHDQRIIDLALDKLPPVEIAIGMLSASNPSMLITLVRTILTSRQEANAGSIREDKKMATEIAEIVLSDSFIADEQRHVVAASIFELVGVNALATEHWLGAVKSKPMNAHYRLKAARALQSIGRLDEALHQVVLGSTLTTEPAMFEHLASQIRATIASTTK